MSFFYGYGRASLDTQVYTVPIQEEKLKKVWQATAADEGVVWGGMFADPATKSKVPLCRRTAGYELILRLQPGDHVGVTKLDRAFRSVAEAATQIKTWVDKGITVHVIDFGVNTKTSAGRLLIHILAAVAEFERGLIQERTRAVMNSPKVKEKLRTRRLRGKVGNYAPLGFKFQGAPGRKVQVEDAKEREVMSLIVQWHDEDDLSWYAIARQLLLRKIFSRGKRQWHPDRVKKAYFQELALRARSNGTSPPNHSADSPSGEPTPAGPST